MAKRLICLIVSVLMVVSLLPMGAFAEESGNVAKIGNAEYATLSAAISAAESGDTVTLISDATVDALIEIKSSQNITLDLGTYTVSGSMSSRLFAVSGTLTIKGTSGTITNTGSSNVISNGNTLTIESGVTITASSAYAVYNTGTLTVNGGTITGGSSSTGYAVYNASGSVTINGGTFTGTNTGVGAIRNNATLVINAGTVGDTTNDIYGVYNAGTVTVNGGTLSGSTAGLINTTSESVVTVYAGTLQGGKRGLYNSTGKATIYGGTFSGSEYGLMTNSPDTNTTLVYAGTFKGDSRAIIGYLTSTIADGSYVVSGRYDLTECVIAVSVAKIGSTNYSSLQSAIDSASSGATVTLQVDTEEDIVIPSGADVTLDLNGKTLTNVSSNTITNNGTLTITDSTATESEDGTLTCGTVDNVTHAKAAVYNEMDATCTILAGQFTRSLEAGTSSSNNGGNSYYTILNHGTMNIGSESGDNYISVSNTGSYSSMIENGWQDGSKNTNGNNSVMNIYGGNFTGGLYNVKNDDYGVLNIYGGTFSGTNNVLSWNELTISGGNFTSTSMCVYTAYADATMDKGTTSITGGNFKSTGKILNVYNTSATYAVSGGTFSQKVDPEYCTVGFTPTANEDGTYGVTATYIGVYGTEGESVPATVISEDDGVLVVKASASSYSTTAYPTTSKVYGTDGSYIFAGWYTDSDCTTACDSSMWSNSSATYYAKFVDADVLSVQCAFTYDVSGYGNIWRFVSSMDSINGTKFYFTVNGAATDGTEDAYDSYKVSGANHTFSPSDFSTASKKVWTDCYFDSDKSVTECTVTASWVTADGTIVTGNAYKFTQSNTTGVLTGTLVVLE